VSQEDEQKQAPATGRALVPPRGGWLRGELHAHSTHSDGKHSVPLLARRARAAGLDLVALTDHNTTSGHTEAFAREEVLFLGGEELTTFDGHFCLYGIDETVEWHRRGQRRSIAEIADEVRAAGGLVSLAHPYQIGAPVCAGCRWPGEDPPPGRLDLMEIWSGCYAERGVEIERALALWDRWGAEGHAPIGIAGRDWHGPNQIDDERRRFARTVVRAASASRAAILDGLRAGAVYLSSGPHIELKLVAGRHHAGIGEQLGAAGDAEVRMLLTGPVPAGARLQLLKDARIIARWPALADEQIVEPLARSGRYRAEVRGADGELILVTNHITLDIGDR